MTHFTFLRARQRGVTEVIANWFETHISREKDARALWMGLLPIAHTHTLFIAYHMSKDPAFSGVTNSDMLRKAWVAQTTGVPSILGEADVDKECLERLEEEMFERTNRTGPSGNLVLFLPRPSNRVRNCLCKVRSSNYRRVQSTRRSRSFYISWRQSIYI